MTFYYNKFFNLIEYWVFAFAIVFPMLISLCVSAKRGDELNAQLFKEEKVTKALLE